MDKELKDVLAAIETTKGLKDKIHKELGLTKKKVTEAPEDMYEFSYKKPDLESRSYMITHGKCADKAQAELISWGYEFIQTRHFPLSDKTWCRVRCVGCGKQLDEKKAIKLEKERKEKREKARADYLLEKQIREEWEAEQILLGKL